MVIDYSMNIHVKTHLEVYTKYLEMISKFFNLIEAFIKCAVLINLFEYIEIDHHHHLSFRREKKCVSENLNTRKKDFDERYENV